MRLGGSSIECAAKYARCVLDPHYSAAAKVPDGACHSVVVEYDLSVAFVPDANGNAAVALIPGLPCSLIGITGNFTGPNREGALVNQSATLANPQGVALMFPFRDFFSGVNSATAPATVYYNQNSSNIVSARAVSYKLEVMPTGPLLQQGGAAVAARIPVFSHYTQAIHDSGTNISGQAYAGNSNHAWLQVRGAQNTFTSLSAYPDARTTVGTESSVLLGMPDDNEFTPIFSYTQDQAGTGGTLTTDSFPWVSGVGLNGSGSGAWGGVADISTIIGGMIPSSSSDVAAFGNFWQPEHTVALAWAGQSLTNGQGYTARARICMELCISHFASLYRPFVTPPEPDLPEVRAKVRSVYRELPPSLPKEESSPGWWSRLTGVANGVANFASELGIPVLSPVAGLVGKFSKMLM